MAASVAVGTTVFSDVGELRVKEVDRLVAGAAMVEAFGARAIIDGDQEFVLFWRSLPWDHAPGALLLGEAGGVASRLDGTPYNPTKQTPGLLVESSQAAWNDVFTTLLTPSEQIREI